MSGERLSEEQVRAKAEHLRWVVRLKPADMDGLSAQNLGIDARALADTALSLYYDLNAERAAHQEAQNELTKAEAELALLRSHASWPAIDALKERAEKAERERDEARDDREFLTRKTQELYKRAEQAEEQVRRLEEVLRPVAELVGDVLATRGPDRVRAMSRVRAVERDPYYWTMAERQMAEAIQRARDLLSSDASTKAER